MLSIAAFLLSGAAITLLLHLPFSVIGTGNYLKTSNLKNWNRPTSTGSLAAIPGVHQWFMVYLLMEIRQPIRILPLLILATIPSTEVWSMARFIPAFIKILS